MTESFDKIREILQWPYRSVGRSELYPSRREMFEDFSEWDDLATRSNKLCGSIQT